MSEFCMTDMTTDDSSVIRWLAMHIGYVLIAIPAAKTNLLTAPAQPWAPCLDYIHITCHLTGT